MIMFDLTNRESFSNVKNWIQSIKTHAPKDICLLLVGNKCDRESMRQVGKDEAQAFATANNMKYMEASALQNIGVAEALEEIMSQMYTMIFIEGRGGFRSGFTKDPGS